MITLIPFQPGHVTSLISWIESEEMLMQFAGPSFQFPLTASQLPYQRDDPKHPSFSLVKDFPREMLGYGEIHLNHDIAFLCRLMIAPDKRGKGFGKSLMQSLLSEMNRYPEVRQVELNVFDFNTPAINLYLQFGFVVNPDKIFERLWKGQVWKAINMVLVRN